MSNVPLMPMGAAAAAGLIATQPMTMFLEWADGAPLSSVFSSLPPRQLTREMLHSAGFSPRGATLRAATWTAHFGYGSAAATPFPLQFRCDSWRQAALGGAVYGLEVWAASYLGWLPAIQSRTQAPRQSLRVNATMIAAHLIWGVSVGLLTKALTSSATALRSPSPASSLPPSDAKRPLLRDA